MKENKGIICPMPRLWNAIYQISKKEYIKKYQIWDKEEEFHQCVPLILAGWWASDDLQKKIRWNQLIDWIKKYELNFILSELEFVAERINIQKDKMWYYGE